MSCALGVLFILARLGIQHLRPSISRACCRGVSDTTLLRSQAIGRVSSPRRHELIRLGCSGVASSDRVPGILSLAGCGLPSEAKP